MEWKVEYIPEAEKDLEGLDHTQQLQVIAAIRKVSTNPLPFYEGGYGKPLGNFGTSKLSGYLKIKLKKVGIRVVYTLVKQKHIMRIVVISVREGQAAYRQANRRNSKLQE